jgi:ATP-binding cassette subfamily B protein
VLVIEGSMTVGNLTTFIFYTIYIAIYLGVLSGLYTDFMNAVGASERIFQILDTVPRINTNGGVYPEENKKSADVDVTEDSENILNEIVSKKNMAGHIMFDNISFSYPTRPDIQVLDSFSLEVKPCQTVAIVGSSGSGKSTVFSLLERFYEVQQNSEGQRGSIFLDGVDIRNLDPRYLHTVVSIVPQEPTLFSGTIFSNIIYSSLARDPLGTTVSPSLDSVIDAAKQANAHDFIMKFPEQYDTLVGERGVRLSGGQKQRIAIARALIAAPKVLLLDEATSALDSESEQLVQEAIENLMSSSSTAAPDRSRRKGITVMIIAHRLSTVRDADQIVMLGRPVRRELNVDVEVEESVLGTSKEYETGSSIIDVGTHDELLSRCKEYRNLVQRQLSQKKPSDSSVSEQGHSSSDDQKCNPIDNDDD